MTRRKTSLLWAMVAILALVCAGPVTAEEPLKVGFVYVSPIGDAGWTYQHDLGRLELEKALGDKIRTKYIESVPEGSEAERVIRDLAQSGHDLIFTTSFGYMNPTIKVAKMFPKKPSNTPPVTRLPKTWATTWPVFTRAATFPALWPAR